MKNNFRTRYKVFIKSISLVLVACLGYSQLLFAASSPRDILMQAKAGFDAEDQRRLGSEDPALLTQSQGINQSVVDQQNDLADLQKMNFSLTTQNGDILKYVGDKLNSVQRQDGTELRNISLDDQGHIANADLKLSDGSIQVFQNGNILAYQTPDGTQVIYENGQIQKTITKDGLETKYSYTKDAAGNILNTILENLNTKTTYDAQGRLKEVLDIKNSINIFYTDGVIDKILKSDGGEYRFKRMIVNNEIQASLDYYQNNEAKYYYEENEIVKILTKDGFSLQNIVWSQDKIKSVTCISPDGSSYAYADGKLLQSVDTKKVVTNYSYTADRIIGSASNMLPYQTSYFEYLLDGSLVKTGMANGDYVAYHSEGFYRGLKSSEVMYGFFYQYEYKTDSAGKVAGTRTYYPAGPVNLVTIQNSSNQSASTNPSLKLTAYFSDEKFVDQYLNISASEGSKSLSIKLNSNSQYIFNGITYNLNYILKKNTFYNIELRWEASGIGLYIYQSNTTRPASPTALIKDRSWNPSFKIEAANVEANLDPLSTKSGNYTTKAQVSDKYGSGYSIGANYQKINFKFLSNSNSNKLTFSWVQSQVNNIVRTITFAYEFSSYGYGRWLCTVYDLNKTTGKSIAVSAFYENSMNLLYGKDYVAEIIYQNNKANLYVYGKGLARPKTPLASLDAFNTTTQFGANSENTYFNGRTVNYSDYSDVGTLRAPSFPDQTQVVNKITIVKPLLNDFEFSFLKYNSDFSLKEIKNKNGSKFIFNNGILSQALDPEGKATAFSFSQNSYFNLLGSEIIQGGLSLHYDESGSLSSASLNGQIIHYLKNSTRIDYIEKSDGTEIHDIVFDSNGNIVNARIITPDGDQKIYEDRHLKRVVRADHSESLFVFDSQSASSKLAQIVTSQAIVYNFSYTPTLIEALIDPSTIPADSSVITKMEYDSNFNLIKAIRQNNEIIQYSTQGQTSQVLTPNHSPKVFHYQSDGSYSVVQDNVETFYDVNNQIQKTVISPTQDNLSRYEVAYQYDKIRQITRDGILVFKYSYTFDPDNKELLRIEDLIENSIKTYKDSKLVSVINKDTGVLSVYLYQGLNILSVEESKNGMHVNTRSYSYTGDQMTIASEDGSIQVYQNEKIQSSFDGQTSVQTTYTYQNGKVSAVNVARFGRTLHTYNYSYVGSNVMVVDEEGVKRAYDLAQRLVSLEKNGQKFTYAYLLDQEGSQIIEESLIIDPTIQLDPSTVIIKEYSASGVLETQTKADRTTTLFENNKPTKVLSEKGEVLIEYFYDAEGNPSKVYLKNARDVLPDELEKAQQSIESQRAASLLELAKQKNLAYQSVQSQLDPQRQALQSQLVSLQNQYNDVASMKVSGKKAKNQRGDALNQIGHAMDDVRGAIANLDTQAGDAYAALSTQIKQVSDQIESDAQRAYSELSKQEDAMKNEILRQETSPIIYDYYRRILGRDPSSGEYADWIDRVNYDTGDIAIQKGWAEEINKSGSIALDGNGDYLEIADSPDLNFGSGNFTVDTWFNTTTSSPQWQVIATQAQDANNRWFLCLERAATGTTQRLAFVLIVNGVVNVASYHPTYVTQNAWHHAAVVRSGDTFSVYLDGVKGTTNPVKAITLPDFSGSLKIGCNLFATEWNFYGSIESVRISRGVALWVNNFLPPTIYTPSSNTVLLIKSNGSVLADLSSYQRSIGFLGDSKLNKSFYKNEDKVTTNHPGVYDRAAKVLSSYLSALPELVARQTYVASVKNKVKAKISAYLAKSDIEKQAFASLLGLSSSDLITLSNIDAQKILLWLDTRSLHFGQSAFLSLEAILDQKGIAYAREDIAEKAILIDILSGVISPLDDGDLVLSLFSLNKVAQIYGLNLLGANLNWGDLSAIYQSNPTTKIIAHVNGNHFLVIQAITADSVTYMDPGRGADKQNEVITLSKKDFLRGWQGNVILEQTKLQSVTNYQSKTLSATQTQKIRGAFLFFFIPAIIGAIASIGGVVASVLAGIAGIVSGVGVLVAGALSSVGGFLASFGQGISYIGNAIFQGISFAASSLWGALGNAGSFLSQNVFGSLAKAGFGNTLFQNAVKIGLNFAVSKGLDSLGVNPIISSLISAFVTGGAEAFFNSATVFSANSFMAQGVKSLAFQGSQTLLQQMGVDANLSNALSLASGKFVDGIFTGNLGGQLVRIGQDLGSGLAQYGFEKLGTTLGLPAFVAQAAGSPIAASLGQGLQNGNLFGQNIIKSVQDGLFNGVIAYGVDFASKNITNNETLRALSSRVISGAIEGVLLQKDIFKGIYGAIKQSVLGVFSTNQADLLANSATLSAIIAQKGVQNGLEIYLTNIFNRQSVESIQRSGGVASVMNAPKEQITLPDGRNAQIARVSSGEGLLFDSSNKLLGFERNGLYQTGEFGITNTGEFGLISGKSFGVLSSGTYYEATVQDGNVIQIKTIMPDQARLDIDTSGKEGGIQLDQDGYVADGQMTLDQRASLAISNGMLDGVQIIKTSPYSNPLSAYWFASDIWTALSKDTTAQGSGSSVVNQIKSAITTAFIFGNGFENKERPENTPDPLMDKYVKNVETDNNLLSIGREMVVYLYEMTGMARNGMDWLWDFNPALGSLIFGQNLAYADQVIQTVVNQSSLSFPASVQPFFESVQNFFRQFSEYTGLGNNLVQEVIEELDKLQISQGRIKDGIVFAHSGFTAPILTAIEQKIYDVDTVIIYEGPHPNYQTQFTNPNLKRIIHVMGSNHGVLNSFQEGDATVPFLGWAEFSDPASAGFENINIEIADAFHTDYSYNSDSYKPGGEFYGATLERETINRKVNLFMRDLYKAALDDQQTPGELNSFFLRLEAFGAATKSEGRWKIDPSRLRNQ